jgi:hypothetical protein
MLWLCKISLHDYLIKNDQFIINIMLKKWNEVGWSDGVIENMIFTNIKLFYTIDAYYFFSNIFACSNPKLNFFFSFYVKSKTKVI